MEWHGDPEAQDTPRYWGTTHGDRAEDGVSNRTVITHQTEESRGGGGGAANVGVEVGREYCIRIIAFSPFRIDSAGTQSVR